jgi:hypothetical protein
MILMTTKSMMILMTILMTTTINLLLTIMIMTVMLRFKKNS